MEDKRVSDLTTAPTVGSPIDWVEIFRNESGIFKTYKKRLIDPVTPPTPETVLDIDYATLYGAVVGGGGGGGLTRGWYNVTDVNAGLLIMASDVDRIVSKGFCMFMNPDHQGVGTYGGVGGFTNNAGVWTPSKEIITITYTGLTGAFSVGETVDDGISATGIIVTDDGSTMTLHRTSTDLFLGGCALNGESSTAAATSNVITNASALYNGMVVIRNNNHHWVADSSLFDGTPPEANLSAYPILTKIINHGYVPEIREVTYDINYGVTSQSDNRGNFIKYQSDSFQWGRNGVTGNTCNSQYGGINNMNSVAACSDNTVICGGFTADYDNLGRIRGCTFNTNRLTEFRFSDPSNYVDFCHFAGRGAGTFQFPDVQYTWKRFDEVTSSFDRTVAITGLSTIAISITNDCLGLLNVTSTNPTENITSITLPPFSNKLKIKPEAGLTLTITHGTGTGNPRCKGAANAVLDGSLGEWIIFERDPVSGEVFEYDRANYA